jgi:methyltransferase (TIGR00027 family)
MGDEGPGRLKSGEPSATAMGVALRRAAHQLIDQPLVFADPLATRIIGASVLEQLKGVLDYHRHPFNLALRAHVVARSRFAEDRLNDAHACGVRQYLVLGAGLDTFGWRNPYTDLQVFEVDHPSTQAWKHSCLEAMGAETPGNLVFAPVDFQSQSLDDGLSAAGFDWEKPAFVSWLGVTMYLAEAAVMRTLRALAALPERSEVVFDFGLSPEVMEPQARMAQEALAARVAAAGEPFLSAFDPEALTGQLKALGFSEVEILGGPDLNRLYFEGRSDGLRLADASRLARARV